MIRSFDWRDFPHLHRNRNKGIWLDTSFILTRRMALVPASALLASFAPAMGVFTYVTADEGNGEDPVVGQASHPAGSVKARLIFITPEGAIDSPGVSRLLDHLAHVVAERGALNLMAEVDEVSPVYETLRRNGFVIYTRQRIWTLPPADDVGEEMWRSVRAADEHDVHYLYHTIVPALVQQTEPPPWENMNGLVHSEGDELLGYVHLTYGSTGILTQPFIHTGTDNTQTLLASLYAAIPHRRSRPVYLCVRSHQAWLAPFLNELGFESGPRQAVMVKRMAVSQRDQVPVRNANTRLDNAQPEITSSSAGWAGETFSKPGARASQKVND